jgi:hypothetical protein
MPSSPPISPLEPPEFHPEFGYIWPAAHTRRMVRVGLMATAFGVLFGAVAVLAVTPRANPDVALAVTALSAVPVEETATAVQATSAGAAPAVPVETTTPPVAAKQPTASAASSCQEQTWPYIESQCLDTATRKKPAVRILKPEAGERSAPAQVISPSSREITTTATIDEPPKAAKKREKTEKARQRRRDREVADRERGPYYADPRSAYATPYVSRYETPRRGWGW